MVKLVAHIAGSFRLALSRFWLGEGWVYSSHLAFSGLLALFPFLIFISSLANFIGLARFSDTMVALIFQFWPNSIAKPIAAEVQTVLTIPRSGVLTISGFFTIYFASNGIDALRVSLNRADAAVETRSVLRCRVLCIIFVILAAVILLINSVFLGLIPLLINKFSINLKILLAASNWRYFIAFLTMLFGIISSYAILPSVKKKFINLLPGVLFVLIAWFIASYLFSWYLTNMAQYFSTYAGLTSIVVCMLFLYILGTIFIFGAYLNTALVDRMHIRV